MTRRPLLLAGLLALLLLSTRRPAHADAPPPAPAPTTFDCQDGCYKSYCQPPDCVATTPHWDCFCPQNQSCSVAGPGR